MVVYNSAFYFPEIGFKQVADFQVKYVSPSPAGEIIRAWRAQQTEKGKKIKKEMR